MYKYTKTTTGIEYVNYVTLLTNNKNIKKCIIFDYDLRGYEGLEGLCWWKMCLYHVTETLLA